MARTLMKDVHRDAYFQMPKFLFAGDYKHLSNDARVLYALLKERHELSIKNKWVNKKGEIYHVYSREDMGGMLNLSQPTVRNVIKELKDTKLLEEERPGQGKLNRLFLLIPDYPESPEPSKKSQTKKSFQSENQTVNLLQSGESAGEAECKNFTVNTVEGLQSNVKPGCGLFKQSKNPIVSSEEETLKTEITSSEPEASVENLEKLENSVASVKLMTDTVKNQINYDKVLSDANMYGYEIGILDALVSIMTEVMLFKGDYIVLSKTKIPTAVAQREFRKIFASHMLYQIKRLAQNPNKVNNETLYLKTCLYNLPRNYSHYRAKYHNTGNAA